MYFPVGRWTPESEVRDPTVERCSRSLKEKVEASWEGGGLAMQGRGRHLGAGSRSFWGVWRMLRMGGASQPA